MKKNIIVFVILFYLPLSVIGQKISVDRIEYDGRRQVMTTSKDLKLNKVKYSIGLKTFSDEYKTDWCLYISSFFVIPEDAVVLLKLGNNEVIFLPINNLSVNNISVPNYTPIFTDGNVGWIAGTSKADYYCSIFEISENDLNKIEQYGIIKIRISALNNSYREKEWFIANEILGKYLTKSKKKILKRLEIDSVKENDIWTDF